MSKRYNLVLSDATMDKLTEVAIQRGSSVKEVIHSFIKLGFFIHDEKYDITISEGKTQYKLIIV